MNKSRVACLSDSQCIQSGYTNATDRQTDRRTDGLTDGQTDGRTDGRFTTA